MSSKQQCLSSDIAVLSNTLSSISWPDTLTTETCLGFFFSLPSVTERNSWRHSVADTEAKKNTSVKQEVQTQAWAGTPVSHLSVMVTVTVTAAEMEPGGVLQGLERAAASGYHASPPGELTWDCRSPLWPPLPPPPPSSDNGLFPRSPLLPSNQEAALHLFLRQSLVIWPACSSGAVDSVLL